MRAVLNRLFIPSTGGLICYHGGKYSIISRPLLPYASCLLAKPVQRDHDTRTEEKMNKFNRRDFIKLMAAGSTAGVAGLALPSLIGRERPLEIILRL